MARVLQYHLLYALKRRDRTFVLQRYERITPFAGQKVVQTTQMLSQLYENRAVLLKSNEGTFCASEVACLELVLVVYFLAALERASIALHKIWLAELLRPYNSMRILFYAYKQRRDHPTTSLYSRRGMFRIVRDRDNRSSDTQSTCYYDPPASPILRYRSRLRLGSERVSLRRKRWSLFSETRAARPRTSSTQERREEGKARHRVLISCSKTVYKKVPRRS